MEYKLISYCESLTSYINYQQFKAFLLRNKPLYYLYFF